MGSTASSEAPGRHFRWRRILGCRDACCFGAAMANWILPEREWKGRDYFSHLEESKQQYCSRYANIRLVVAQLFECDIVNSSFSTNGFRFWHLRLSRHFFRNYHEYESSHFSFQHLCTNTHLKIENLNSADQNKLSS